MSPFRVLCVLMLALAVAACGAAATVRQRAGLLVEKGQTAEAARLLEEHVAAHPDAIAERRLLIRVHGVAGDLASWVLVDDRSAFAPEEIRFETTSASAPASD